jgi:GxxExxY protein
MGTMELAEVVAARRRLNGLSERIIGAAQAVSTALGPGFLEKVYENALCWELRKANLRIDQQRVFDVVYDGRIVGEYIPDLLVADSIIVEVKAAQSIDAAHRSQCLNYLRSTDLHLGLVLNFGRRRLEVARIVNDF